MPEPTENSSESDSTEHDKQTVNDADAESNPSPEEPQSPLSRRRALAGLAGLGVLGFGPISTAAEPAQSPTTVQSGDGISIGGERIFEVTASQSFVREDGAEIRDGGSIRGGSLNEIADEVIGATVGGGGLRREDRNATDANLVTSHFGTIGGGAGNQTGTDDPKEGQFATVAGGFRNTASETQSAVGGGSSNDATGSRSVVAGGRRNQAREEFAVVGGGVGNTAAASYATVTGGTGNVAARNSATIVGGRSSIAQGRQSTIVGGRGHFTEGHGATIAGGLENDATGDGAFVAGGRDNVADGAYSFAAGRGAQTDGQDGAVVFGDSSDEEFCAAESDTAYFQMPVYAQSFNNTSTATVKQNLEPVDPESVLTAVESLDVSTWQFERGDESTHMGPTAEDFYETFELGGDEQTISTVDADGVALAAIQGLSKRLEQREERLEAVETDRERQRNRIENLESETERRADRIEELEAKTQKQTDRIDDLESRLSALEAAVESDTQRVE